MDGLGSEQRSPADANPFAGLDNDEATVVAVLRGRHRGASVDSISADCALRSDLVERCLSTLSSRHLAVASKRRVAAFHVPDQVEMWDLSDLAWRSLRWMPARLPTQACGPATTQKATAVPVELWPMFWSGQKISECSVPRDAEQICETLLQAPMPEARVWAMLHLPADVLRRSRHANDPLLRRLLQARSA